MSLPAALHRLRTALGTRYDAAALQPPSPGPAAAPPAAHEAVCADLLLACQVDAIAPAAPAWGVFVLSGTDRVMLQTIARTLSLQLDGSLQLQARRSAAARLALRLRVKWQDALGRPAFHGDTIWDCGHAIGTPLGLQALARLAPRRPTLVVVEAPAPPLLLEAVRVLASRSALWAHPVRLLVLAPVDAPLQVWPGTEAPQRWSFDDD